MLGATGTLPVKESWPGRPCHKGRRYNIPRDPVMY